MSTDNINPNKGLPEVPPKDAKTELTEQELSTVSAGISESISIPYEKIQFKYKEQEP